MSQVYELSGVVKVVGDTETFGSGFNKREFVVTVEDGKYPQDIKLEIVQDNVSLLDPVNVGDTVTAKFDIRGREYNGKYYTNLQCWRLNIDSAGGGGQADFPEPDMVSPAAGDDYGDEIPY